MDSITNLVFQLAVLLMSVVIHEFAHGWAAFYLATRPLNITAG